MVVVFGGLTLALQDEQFIKLKPTIVNSCSASCCSAACGSDGRCSRVVLDSMFDLTDEGWRKLTLRWALFFFVLAALNEIVWRTHRPISGSASRCSASCR